MAVTFLTNEDEKKYVKTINDTAPDENGNIVVKGEGIAYDNTVSGIDATTVQGAIDKLSGGNVDLTGYATEQFVRDGYQPKGDYLGSEALPDAIDTALAQAKESGEFDGPPGSPGDDYVLTPADKEEIAGIAAGMVEVPEGSGGGIAITGATVGQTVKISAVDENGVPTAWEPVEFPSGGSEKEWTFFKTVTLEETASYIELNLSDIENVQEVSVFAQTKQEESDGTAYTGLQRGRVLVNERAFIGWLNYFSGYSGNMQCWIHIENVGCFLKGAAWTTTDSTYPTAVNANGTYISTEKITKVRIDPWLGGAFSIGSTITLWYR